MSKDIIWHKYPEWHKYPDELPSKKGEYWVSDGLESLDIYVAKYSPERGFDPGARIYVKVWADPNEEWGTDGEQIQSI